MPQASVLKFGRTDAGYRLRIEGRGTMQQSKPAEAFVDAALNDPNAVVVVDLSDCEYLDSTFLGCLIGMNRRFGAARIRVSAPDDRTRKLFGPTKLDLFLHVSPDAPQVIGDYVPILGETINSREMARHIMECHRRLAEIPGPQQTTFAAIAQQMAREIERRP